MVRPTGPITFDAPILGESIPSAVASSHVNIDHGMGPMVPYSAVHPRPSGMNVDFVPQSWREDTRPRDTIGFDSERDRPTKYYLDTSYGKTPVYPSVTQGIPKLPRIIDHDYASRKPSWFPGTAQQWHAAITGGLILD